MKFGTLQRKSKFQTKHKSFGINIYKFCDKTGYTYSMEVSLGKDRTQAIADMTITYATVKHLTEKVEGHGHELYTDNDQLLFLS
jgi:hypothetical protein